MPKSFLDLVTDAQHGRGFSLHLCDGLVESLVKSLEANDVVWLTPIASVEPTGNYSPHSATFFRVDENGKHQWCVRFPSGTTQVIATEP